MIKSNYELLKKMEPRLGMWTGENSLKSLHTFLNGYNLALEERDLIKEGQEHFFDWVAKRLGYYESTAGWANMILAYSLDFDPKNINWTHVLRYNVSDEEHKKSIELFYKLLEEFIKMPDHQNKNMKKVHGDLIQLALENQFDVIIHGCNCFCTMGAGIAKGIKQHFPEAYKKDLKTIKGDKSKLGKISYAEIKTDEGNLVVVNAYTQYHWKGKGPKVDYEAVRKAFQEIKSKFSGLRIGYPAIGAGLAGGNWEIIENIINEELEYENHTFVIF